MGCWNIGLWLARQDNWELDIPWLNPVFWIVAIALMNWDFLIWWAGINYGSHAREKVEDI